MDEEESSGKVHTQKKKQKKKGRKNTLFTLFNFYHFYQVFAVKAHIKLAFYKLRIVGA